MNYERLQLSALQERNSKLDRENRLLQKQISTQYARQRYYEASAELENVYKQLCERQLDIKLSTSQCKAIQLSHAVDSKVDEIIQFEGTIAAQKKENTKLLLALKSAKKSSHVEEQLVSLKAKMEKGEKRHQDHVKDLELTVSKLEKQISEIGEKDSQKVIKLESENKMLEDKVLRLRQKLQMAINTVKDLQRPVSPLTNSKNQEKFAQSEEVESVSASEAPVPPPKKLGRRPNNNMNKGNQPTDSEVDEAVIAIPPELVKKRGRPPKSSMDKSNQPNESDSDETVTAPAPVRKKKGGQQPNRNMDKANQPNESDMVDKAVTVPGPARTKKRGRPPLKNREKSVQPDESDVEDSASVSSLAPTKKRGKQLKMNMDKANQPDDSDVVDKAITVPAPALTKRRGRLPLNDINKATLPDEFDLEEAPSTSEFAPTLNPGRTSLTNMDEPNQSNDSDTDETVTAHRNARTKRRGRPPLKDMNKSTKPVVSDMVEETVVVPAPTKKRSRPPNNDGVDKATNLDESDGEEPLSAPQKKRGRPRKDQDQSFVQSVGDNEDQELTINKTRTKSKPKDNEDSLINTLESFNDELSIRLSTSKKLKSKVEASKLNTNVKPVLTEITNIPKDLLVTKTILKGEKNMTDKDKQETMELNPTRTKKKKRKLGFGISTAGGVTRKDDFSHLFAGWKEDHQKSSGLNIPNELSPIKKVPIAISKTSDNDNDG